MLIIDDYSRLTWVAFLKEKSEAFEKFKVFKALNWSLSRISYTNEEEIVYLDDLILELNRMDKFHHQIQCSPRVSFVDAKKSMRDFNSNSKR